MHILAMHTQTNIQHSTAQHIILMAEPILRRTQALHVQIWYTVVSFFAVERVRDGNKQN